MVCDDQGVIIASVHAERPPENRLCSAAKQNRCNPMRITALDAYPIFDSRGNPTVEAIITLDSGDTGRGIVPSGASTGQYEALELRDKNPALFRGKSVFKAIENIQSEIAPLLMRRDVTEQGEIDQAMCELDGTENKSRLGANAILAVSMAVANAAAASRDEQLFEYLAARLGEPGVLLPLPEIQIFGGGAHAQHRIDLQDFMIICTGATSYAQVMEMTFNIYHAARDIMHERGKLHGLADEGGFWPDFKGNEDVFETLLEAIVRAGYEPGKDVTISLDIAASDLYEAGRYHFKSEGRVFNCDEFAKLMIQWCEKYPIISIEDPMADVDWDGWKQVHAALGDRVQLIGDDLFTTNLERIEQGIARGVANSVLIKLNQIGTVSETIAAIQRTQEAGWLPVVSARSGETEDAFIAHLAVATNAGQLKVGSFARSERMVKWNEIIRIERALGDRAVFKGSAIYHRILRHPRVSLLNPK